MTSSESQNNVSVPSGTSSPQPAAPQPIAANAVSSAPISDAMTSRVGADSPPESHDGPALTQRPTTRPHPVPRKVRGTHREISIRQWWRTTKQRFFGNARKSMDSRQKKTAVLGIILAIVFIAVLVFALGSGPSRAKAASEKSENPKTAGKQITGGTENWTLPEPYSTSLRNPTKIGDSASAANTQSETTLRVQGIVYSSKKPSAIIANQVVFEGDSIEGARVTKIERDSVEFEKDGKRWQLQVQE